MKNQYRELCKQETTIPVFCRDWWLDAVCGENNWNVCIVEKNGTVIGALPYYLSKGSFGLPQIVMPHLTQHMGIWIKYPVNQNYIKKLSYEKEVMYEIIDQTVNLGIAYFSQHFHYSTTNWLPFMWKGFQQTTRYTYVIDDLSDLDNVFSQFEGDKRTQIRKASRFLTLNYDYSPLDFYNLSEKALARQQIKPTYDYKLLKRIFHAAYTLDQGKSFYCTDKKGNVCGALFIIWDETSAYNLISVFDPEYRNLGVGPFLIWEAIKYVAPFTKRYDFEGSIVESYERAYRSFGGIQKPYFNIRKTYSPYYLMMDGYNDLKKGIKAQIKASCKDWRNRFS